MIAAFGDVPTNKNDDDLNDETHDNGTTTGDDHDVGTTTVGGAKTNDETGTYVIVDLATVTIALDATDVGTFVYSTMANPDEIVITWAVGSD
jgi:hypothetical protein